MLVCRASRALGALGFTGPRRPGIAILRGRRPPRRRVRRLRRNQMLVLRGRRPPRRRVRRLRRNQMLEELAKGLLTVG